MRKTLSIRMVDTLLRSKSQLGDEAQRRIQSFIHSQQLEDGSFIDKNGQSDLYYTAFGWLLCRVFGVAIPRKAALAFLNAQVARELDLVHYAAYHRCCLLKGWHPFKKDAIPYKKNAILFEGFPHGDAEAPYSLFVRLSLVEDTGKRVAEPKEWLDALHDYQTPDGGYSNQKDGTTATVNATAAALCVLKQLKSPEADAAAHFLLCRQHTSGGYAASPDAPLPDLLSTATALFALHINGHKPETPARAFIEAHWNERTGGFSATLFDESSDIEYMFYGLLALGTL